MAEHRFGQERRWLSWTGYGGDCCRKGTGGGYRMIGQAGRRAAILEKRSRGLENLGCYVSIVSQNRVLKYCQCGSCARLLDD